MNEQMSNKKIIIFVNIYNQSLKWKPANLPNAGENQP